MSLRYAILLAMLAVPALVGAQTRVQAPEDPAVLAANLTELRALTPERKAFSATDTRRYTLARRILALVPDDALAHEELALRDALEFDWRRRTAERRGRWDAAATRGMSGGANRARRRAEEHVASALTAQPDRAGAHRLALRIALLADDSLSLVRAAEAYRAARPHDPDAALAAALAAWRAGDGAAADSLIAAARPGLAPDDRRALDDPAPFYTADEEALATSDSTSVALQAWLARDPLRLTPENERHLEHAARLITADLLFGETTRGIRGWTTARGQVYVRFGPPDYDAGWTAENFRDKVFGSFERWAYGGPDGFVLTFEDSFRSGDYRFASSAAGEDDVTRAGGLFRTVREHYTLAPPGGVIVVDAMASAFRGVSGQTDLVVALAVPLAARDVPAAAVSFGLDAGAFLLSENASAVAEALLQVPVVSPDVLSRRDTTATWTGAVVLAAAPGTYTLDVEARQTATRRAGAQRETIELPRFGSDELRVSDVLLASSVEENAPTGLPGTVERGAFSIRPVAAAAFRLGEPIYAYVEVYGLHVEDGRARYDVEAALQPQDRAGALRRLSRSVLGRRGEMGVAVQATGERAATGTQTDDAQYVVLDATGQRPGAYVLTLSIRDLVSGTTVASSRAVTLY